MDELLAPLQDVFEGQIVRICPSPSRALDEPQLTPIPGLPRPAPGRDPEYSLVDYLRRKTL